MNDILADYQEEQGCRRRGPIVHSFEDSTQLSTYYIRFPNLAGCGQSYYTINYVGKCQIYGAPVGIGIQQVYYKKAMRTTP